MLIMRAVGIRELKNNLSHYVRLVEAGESVLVTDRGTVVAELGPPGGTRPTSETDPLTSRLVELARKGRAVLGAPHDPSLYVPQKRIVLDGTVEALLAEDRGQR